MTNNGSGPAPVTGATSKRDWLWVGLIVAVGGWLRFRNLDAGIPYAVGADEPQIMERVVAMMRTGDFNPHFFDWPSLTFYAQLVVACLTFLGGAMQGHWSSLDQIGPQDLYLHGRMLTAALGTATIVLVYLAGIRWNRATGLLAAALFAALPSHVRESHFVLTDVPTAFLTTLTLWLAFRAAEHPGIVRFALAGLAAGLAASTKYNGLIVFVVPLITAWTVEGEPSDRIARTTALVGMAGVGFLAGTPYALLDLPAFLNGYARLAEVFSRERPGPPGASVYVRHLQLTMGTVGLWLTAVGLVGAAWRSLLGPDRWRWLVVVLFPVAYFQVMAARYQIYGRYLMPLLPFTSLLAAVAITTIAARLRPVGLPHRARQTAVAVLIVAALISPIRSSLAFTSQLGLESTIDQAYAWMRSNVATGERIVMERQPFVLLRPDYEVQNVRSLIEKDYAGYVADGVAYLVASSEGYGAAFAGNAPREDFEAYQTLFTIADEVATFRPSDDTPGPELRIFRIRPPSTP